MLNNTSGAVDRVAAGLVGQNSLPIRLAVPKFHYECQHIRDGKVIDEWAVDNIVTTEGAKDMLDKYFAGSGYTAAWYLGLISSASYSTTPDITDVAANLGGTSNGWAECSASYAPNYDTPAGTSRAAISFSAASGTDPVSKASSATVDITFMATGTVKGAFIASNGTRLNATGVLYSAALFAGDRSVVDNDQLKITVTVSLDI
jgi:hypothetical protein